MSLDFVYDLKDKLENRIILIFAHLVIILVCLKQKQDNELIILWTSGVRKIQLVNLFFIFSVFVTIIYLFFSTIITPYALYKSRQLLSNESFTSFLPTIKVQQFSDSFSGITFIISYIQS